MVRIEIPEIEAQRMLEVEGLTTNSLVEFIKLYKLDNKWYIEIEFKPT